ncbi:hypothetical protein GCM10027418_08720 [Mariniluteicoccus endophyticus]
MGLRLTKDQALAYQGTQKLLRDHDRGQLATWLDRALDTPPGRVVVVGEPGRGRSTLVAALAGTEPAAPGTEEYAEVTVVEGRPLAGVHLVDTPGAGLDSATTDRAVQAAMTASALVFVTDAGAPLSRPELDFLERTSQRVARVVVVVARTDRYPQTWRTVLEEDRRLLAAHAPRFADAPVVAVAASLLLEARRTDDATADLLLEASGVSDLTAALDAAVADGEMAPFRNYLRGAEGALTMVLDELEGEAEVGDLARDELEARRVELEQRQDAAGRWAHELQRDLARVRQGLARCAGDRLDAYVDEQKRAIGSADRMWSGKQQQRWSGELSSALATIATDLARGFTDDLTATVTAAVAEAEADIDRLMGGLAEYRAEADSVLAAPRSQSSVLDPSLIGSLVLGAGLAGQAATAAGVAAAGVFSPIGLVVGGTLLAVNIGFRGARQNKQQLVDVLMESSRRVRSDVLAYADGVLTEVGAEVRILLTAHNRRALAAVNAELRALEADSRREDEAAARRRRRRDEKLEAVRTQLEAVRAAADGLKG